MDLYVWFILKYTCQVAVCVAESLVSKYIFFDCLVRIFWKAASHVGDYMCRNVAWLHLAWVYFPPSPHLRLGHAGTRASFGLRGRAVLVACNSLTSLAVWGPGLPPIHRWGRAHALPFANTIFNSQVSFKKIFLNVEIKISNGRSVHGRCSESYYWNFKKQFILDTLLLKFISYWNLFHIEIYFNGIFLIGIVFTYTTSNVYLTIRFNYWNLCIKYSWNYYSSISG